MSLSAIHRRCGDTFRAGLFPDADARQLGASSACKVYDALVGDCFQRDDCIGENFNQLLLRIAEEWFGNYRPGSNLDYYFCNYVLLLYLVVERVDQIFDVINKDGKSKLFRDYHQKNFPTQRRINKWANFFKHPKEFLFTHWPRYCLAGEMPSVSAGDVVINYDFIKTHYFSETCPRPAILENSNRVYVEVPNLEDLTRHFCEEMDTFFDFICANKLIADFLKQKSTIELIYDTDETTAGNEAGQAEQSLAAESR
jgi:hypothetical protein